ncbi:MAG: hypothetical protein QOI63_1023 [Thermoplasmata archaeon]|jgi:hypothetical protein|nr:hypothetical protein [Thermoplasmata archaeon]
MTAPLRRFLRDTGSVSPVIGTVLVLAITVLGIASILYWGAPTIDRIQSRNSQTAMEGEFEGLRDASQELSVPDHSRFPTIAMPGGSLSVAQGTRFMVTVDADAANPNCDFHVTDWSDTSGANLAKVTVAGTNCGRTIVNCGAGAPGAGQACLEVYSVGTSSLVKQSIPITSCPVTPTAVTCITPTVQTPTPATNVDFSQGDWMFQLTDGATTTPVVYAQAWLHSNDQVAWKLKSSSGVWEDYLDGGAIFSRTGSTYYLEKEAPIGDTAFGPAYVGLWLRTFKATGYGAIDGQGSHQLFLSLKGNSVRSDLTAAYRLRYDFGGGLAQPWCNALLFRDAHLTNSATPALYIAAYKQDPALTCTTGGAGADSLGLRSVCYTQFAAVATAPANTCTTAGTAFRFRFLHARIDASLSI